MIAFLYIIGIAFLYSQNAMQPGIILLGLMIVFASIVIALFAVILEQLLHRVILLKNELDLTI